MAETLGHQTRRGLSWSLAGAVVVNATRLLVLVVLGRLLTSTDFGVVAAAVSVNTIVHSFRDVGIGPALIQRKELRPEHWKTAFAVSTYLGIALTAALVALAPAIGRAFHIAESTDVIRALAGLFFLRNLSATSQVACRRDMKFRFISVVDSLSFVLGSVVSMISAAWGAGPWALVAGYLVEEVLATVLYLVYSPPAVSLRIDLDRLRELLSFGVGQTVTLIANTCATYGDNIVVGEALGAKLLGFYSRAYDLMRFPVVVFETIVASVLFPAFSRIQDARSDLALNLRRVTFVNALLLCPASVCLIVLAPEVIRILVGPGWDDAVLPFQILSVTVVLRTNQRLGILVAQAAGAANAVAIVVVIYMCTVVGGAALTVRWGIMGVAGSTAFAILVASIGASYLGMRVSGLPVQKLLSAYVPGLVLAAAASAAAWPLANALRAANAPHVVVFAVVTLAAIAVCVVVVASWLRRPGDFAWLREELRMIARRLRPSSVRSA